MASLTLDQPALGSYAHLLPPSWKPEITRWLAEDTPSFDFGGFVVGEEVQMAELLGKGKTDVRPFLLQRSFLRAAELSPFEQAVLAGVPFVDEVFAQLGCTSVALLRRVRLSPPPPAYLRR